MNEKEDAEHLGQVRSIQLALAEQGALSKNSNKLLSPFTWSNLNLKIKFPKINKQKMEVVPQKQLKKLKKKKPQKEKNNLKQKQKLDDVSKTISLAKNIQSQEKSQQLNKTFHRYKKQPQQNQKKHNQQPNINQPAQKIKLYKREIIKKNMDKTQIPHTQFSQKSHNRSFDRKQSPNNTFYNILNNIKSQRDQTPQEKTFYEKPEKNIIQRKQSPLTSYYDISHNLTRLRSPISYMYKNNTFVTPFSFSFNKMQTFVYKGLVKSNWFEVSQKQSIITPQLVWSDRCLDSVILKKDQLHNHLVNCHILTTKNSLHELQSIHGSEHYPQSFLIPSQYQNFCEQYEQNLVKICLKEIIKSCNTKINFEHKGEKHIGIILQEFKSKKQSSEDNLIGIKLCLYLQHYRKSKNYRYFNQTNQFFTVETKINPNALSSIVKICHDYWEGFMKNAQQKHPNFFSIKVSNIDEDILYLLWNYHCLLLKYQPSYHNLPNRNLWIVKPIASSKGAGISLLKNSAEFLSGNHDRFQLTNKMKYSNKIIQKYIQQPLLLRNVGQFSDRKFDIRQWVLLTYDKELSEPLIYYYEDGYCRFSDKKFTFNHYRSDEAKVHLTNYSISDKTHNSLILLSNLFRIPEVVEKKLEEKYREQINKIIVQTVMNAKQIKFEPNRFELLGFDVLFDQYLKLWLLEINLNPACETSRSTQLEAIADSMILGMMKIVRSASGQSSIRQEQLKQLGWKLIYGKQSFCEVDFAEEFEQAKIKPYYEISLGKQSLIEEVRKRSFMMNLIERTVRKSNFPQFWRQLKDFKREEQVKKEQIGDDQKEGATQNKIFS